MVEIIEALRREHANLVEVLDVLERQVATYGERGRCNREILRDVLDYCRGYPSLCHHPKEDLVYRKLLAVAGTKVLDEAGDLLLEHRELERLTDELEAAIDNLIPDAAASRKKFLRVAKSFLETYRRHIEMEERAFFPAALQNLSEADWADIDRRAAEQRGRAFGTQFDKRFDRFRTEIVAEERTDQETWEALDRVL